MNKHLTIEDYERYVEDDITDEYLVWMESVQEHLLGCEYCQNRLQKFLIADVLSENFNTKAFVGMENYLQEQVEAENRNSLVQNIKQALQKMARPELIENAIESIENGWVQTISFTRNNYPGMLCVVRGEELQKEDKQEYIRNIVWQDGEVWVYVNGTDKDTLYMVNLQIFSVNDKKVQTELAVPDRRVARDELIAVFKVEDEDAIFEANLIPIKRIG